MLSRGGFTSFRPEESFSQEQNRTDVTVQFVLAEACDDGVAVRKGRANWIRFCRRS